MSSSRIAVIVKAENFSRSRFDMRVIVARNNIYFLILSNCFDFLRNLCQTLPPGLAQDFPNFEASLELLELCSGRLVFVQISV